MFRVTCFLLGNHSNPFTGDAEQAAAEVHKAAPQCVGMQRVRLLTQQIEGRGADWSGAIQLWFSDPAEAIAAARDSDAFLPLLSTGTVVDTTLATCERTVMRRAEHHHTEHIRGIFPFRRRAGMDVAAFQRHWWHRHGPIAAQTEHALAYFQYHPLAAEYLEREPRFDGITELHWPDYETAAAAMASRQMVEDQRADAANFVDGTSVQLFLATAENVIAP